jgi:CheY-like chemotaxis protein
VLTTRPDQRLVVARDAWLAVPMAQLVPPALVVLGCRPRDFSDVEVLNMLRCLPDCAHLPVIALTPRATSNRDDSVFAALWTKPLQLKQLRDDLERLLPAPRWNRTTAALPAENMPESLRFYPAPVAWHGHRIGAIA